MSLSPGYSVKCEYTAHKEGVLKEEMVLSSEAGEGSCIKVVVQARVMGKGLPAPVGSGGGGSYAVPWVSEQRFLPGTAGNRERSQTWLETRCFLLCPGSQGCSLHPLHPLRHPPSFPSPSPSSSPGPAAADVPHLVDTSEKLSERDDFHPENPQPRG